jgi:hypothetical protein
MAKKKLKLLPLDGVHYIFENPNWRNILFSLLSTSKATRLMGRTTVDKNRGPRTQQQQQQQSSSLAAYKRTWIKRWAIIKKNK